MDLYTGNGAFPPTSLTEMGRFDSSTKRRQKKRKKKDQKKSGAGTNWSPKDNTTMGFRFRKRLRIIPGFLWVNVSKKGGSLSVGGHGLTANIFKQKFTGPFPIWLSD